MRRSVWVAVGAVTVLVAALISVLVGSRPAGAEVTVDALQHATVTSMSASTAVSVSVSIAVPAGDLLVAFVSSDEWPVATAQTATVFGGSLPWALVVRSNAQPGSAEVWSAGTLGSAQTVTVTAATGVTSGAIQITAIAYSGAAGIGESAVASGGTGTESVTVAPQGTDSVFYAAGTDWLAASPRTLPSDQTLDVQSIDDSASDTLWVQHSSDATLDVTAPTDDIWDMAGVEILSATADATTASASTTSTVPPSDTSTVPPSDTSTVPPSDTSTVPPSDSTTVVPSDTTTVPPSDPTTSSTTAPVTPSSTVPATTTTVPSNGTIFDDEFTNGMSPAWVAWNENGDASNNEAECYRPDNVGTQGGSLILSTQVDSSCAGFSYTSGAVQWNTLDFTYGTVTVRAKMTPGAGAWPAIWLLGANCQADQQVDNGNNCSWPNAGSQEVDIAENLNGPTLSRENLYSGATSDTHIATISDASENWHTYQLIWAPGSLTWTVDGTTTYSVSGDAVPSTPMFLIINAALDGDASIDSTAMPSYAAIDYVRVTQP